MELGHWHTAAPDDDERPAICHVYRRAGRKIFEVELDDRRGHGSAELQTGCHDVYFGPPHPMQFSYDAQEAALLSALKVARGLEVTPARIERHLAAWTAEGSKRKELVESDDEPVE